MTNTNKPAFESRSVQRRKALQRGEPMPTFRSEPAPPSELEQMARELLQEVAEGRGPYKLDNYEFANSVIENSKTNATKVLGLLDSLLQRVREDAVRATVALWREKTGGPWIDSDPIKDFILLNEVYNEGFEAAHDLQHCGHSRGDYRDAEYQRGKPETYKAMEACVGCISVQDAVRKTLEAAAQVLDDEVTRHNSHKPHVFCEDFCEDYGCGSLVEFAKAIRALAPEAILGQPAAKEPKL